MAPGTRKLYHPSLNLITNPFTLKGLKLVIINSHGIIPIAIGIMPWLCKWKLFSPTCGNLKKNYKVSIVGIVERLERGCEKCRFRLRYLFLPHNSDLKSYSANVFRKFTKFSIKALLK